MPLPSYSERVTAVRPRDVDVPGLGTVLVLTFEPEDGSDRPCSLGPRGLANLHQQVEDAADRATLGEIAAVALTGTGRTFLAGADLHAIRTTTSRGQVLELAREGHRVVDAIAGLAVPTVAHLNGAALGGGLEMALACDYRTAEPGVRAIGLPETYLGLIPGWGGCTLLPRLIGPDQALTVILDNPAHNNARLTATDAAAMGLVDFVAPGLDASLAWLAEVVSGAVEVGRATPSDDEWKAAVAAREDLAARRLAGGAPAADRALRVVAAARTRTRAESFELEDEALADLVMTDQLRAGLYLFDVLAKRAKNPAGRPADVEPRQIRSVGIAGAGLMAGQLALLLAGQLGVPVTMRDVDDERAQRGLAAVHEQVGKMRAKGRLDDDAAAELIGRLRVTTDVAALAGSDLVVEAVFEELDVKRRVFAELERVVGPGTVLATNTSALSVTAMAEGLEHPERVVGLHFFNPVAQMPLVEVVRAERTGGTAYATAFAVAEKCRKTAVAVADAPGFVVNRLLVRLLGEVLGALEEGTSVEDADAALIPMGLPMGPFQLLQLVGPAVAEHVLVTLREGLGHRYPNSPGLARMVQEGRSFLQGGGRPSAASAVDHAVGHYFRSRPVPTPAGPAELLERVRRALAEETDLLLREGVAHDAEDVDLAMHLGAGWPLHLGGLTPYLDRSGDSVAVAGRRFHAPGIADVPVL